MTQTPEDHSIESFGYKQELKRTLSLWDLVIYGLIFMVPIAPFGIYGVVAASSGGMVPLAYLIGMVGMIFTALSYARMSEVFPLAGSVYTYANRGINSTVGFFAGWLITLDYLLVPALLYVVSAAALASIFPGVPALAWAIGFIAVNTVVNFFGIEFTAKFNKVVLVLEMIVFAIFITAGVITILRSGGALSFTLKPFYDPAQFNLKLVMGAVSVAVLSFLGFDGISTLSEETKGGRQTVGRATLMALLAAGILFIAQTYVAACLWPNHTTFKNADGAFYEIAAVAGGPVLMAICSLATAFAWGVANALAAQAAVSRLVFSMSRDKLMPSILAAVHPTYQTPYVATLVIAILSMALVVVYQNHIGALASLVNFGALMSFVILHVAVIIHFMFRLKSKDLLRHLILPLLGLGVILYVAINLDRASKILGAWWVGAGLVYYLVLTFVMKRKPAALDV